MRWIDFFSPAVFMCFECTGISVFTRGYLGRNRALNEAIVRSDVQN